MLQPKAHLRVLLRVLLSYESESAKVGQRVFESFHHMDAEMGVAKKLPNDEGTSDTSASFLQDIAALLQLSQKSVAKATFGRTLFGFKWQRWYRVRNWRTS